MNTAQNCNNSSHWIDAEIQLCWVKSNNLKLKTSLKITANELCYTKHYSTVDNTMLQSKHLASVFLVCHTSSNSNWTDTFWTYGTKHRTMWANGYKWLISHVIMTCSVQKNLPKLIYTCLPTNTCDLNGYLRHRIFTVTSKLNILCS